MSTEIEKPIIPAAPALYGIDPSVTYKWVPEKFRKEFDDKEWAKVWEAIKDIKDEKESRLIIQRDYVDRFKGRKVAAKGSPWIKIGPLSSEVALRLEMANSVYQNRLALANAETEREIQAVQAKKISAKRKDAEIKEVRRRAQDANIARGFAAFDPDLIEDVLSDAVRGWEGFVKPFTTWEECGQCLPPVDKRDLFWDIRSNNAWKDVEFESFESAPDLQQV